VLLSRVGGPDSVVWTPTVLHPFIGRVHRITHNHPRGTPPSPEDLEIAMFLGAPGVDAITPLLRYRLWTPTGQWPEPQSLSRAFREVHDPLLYRVWEQRDAGALTDRQVDLLFYRLLWQRMERRFPDQVRFLRERR
jgi:hypothetical protein